MNTGVNPATIDDFLKKGLKVFKQAKAATNLFEDACGARVLEAVQAAPWSPPFDKDYEVNGPTWRGLRPTNSAGGIYCRVEITGKVSVKSLSVEAGLWWPPESLVPDAAKLPLQYVCWLDSAVSRAKKGPPGPDARFFWLEFDEVWHLCVPARHNLDFAYGFTELLRYWNPQPAVAPP